MAVDTQTKRQACLSFSRIFCFQGPFPGEGTSDMPIRVEMGYCYPFIHMAPPAPSGIIGIKWLGNKTWLADRKARRQKAKGALSRMQAKYDPESMLPAERHMIESGAIWVAYLMADEL